MFVWIYSDCCKVFVFHYETQTTQNLRIHLSWKLHLLFAMKYRASGNSKIISPGSNTFFYYETPNNRHFTHTLYDVSPIFSKRAQKGEFTRGTAGSLTRSCPPRFFF